MPQITFTKNGEVLKTLEMKPGEKFWNARESGIQFVEEPNCQGQGRCKKCKCRVNGEDKLSCLERVSKNDLLVETFLYYE